MFIPKGKAVYENLATSYVLVDALVVDLCEGGFSGVIEITLRNSDSRILVERGNVSAIIEKPVGAEFSKTTIMSLAKRARAERGRVSVYAYPPGIADSIAGRMIAEALYTNLSTEFADIEKLILKLCREGDREWFVEVITGGKETLIHIADERYRIISESQLAEDRVSQAFDKNDTSPLGQLVQECHRAGGTFDVYFKSLKFDEPAIENPATEESLTAPGEPPLLNSQASSTTTDSSDIGSETPNVSAPVIAEKDQTPLAVDAQKLSSNPPSNEIITPAVEKIEDRQFAQAQQNLNETLINEPVVDMALAVESKGANPAINSQPLNKISSPQAVASLGEIEKATPVPRVLPTRELMALPGNLEELETAMKMADLRRLMGKIIKTIEEVNRGVEHRDNFQMHLRAGQLKVAEQFPFLDPFGSEFEYLDGEIVSVGKIEPEEFITGLEDALIFAVTEATQASPQPLRLRSFIAEELKNLLERNREEFTHYELDVSIKRIIGPQM
ncbi:MAG: hypothetical protein AB1757_04230 [Acidobacteriota bacterium]